jgi:hypothetical protein
MPAVRMRVALVAVLAVVVLAGCGGPCCDEAQPARLATNGPLSSGVGHNHKALPHDGECAPRSNGAREAFGIDTFTNYGHATVVLDRVVLLQPHNERLIGADVIPGTREPIGTIPWPPNYPSIRRVWKIRKPVQGYRVAPGKSFNLVIGEEPTGTANATSQGVLVYYHDPGGYYMAPNYLGMQIAPGKNGCSQVTMNNVP